MNLRGTFNERLPIIHQEGKRAFGKDITNMAKNTQHEPLKKMLPVPIILPPLSQRQIVSRDAICDYEQEIFQFMTCYPEGKKGDERTDSNVSDKMKHILVDWLVDVHRLFQLKDETLFLALQYLEEYQSMTHIVKEEYQLVGITCLWIASKYEQIYPPRMKKFVDVTAKTYTRSQLTAMEANIIEALDFQLTRVTHLALLQALTQQQSDNTITRSFNLAKYVMQLSFLSGSIPKKYDRKTVVGAAVKLGDSVCKTETNLVCLGCQMDRELYECYKELCVLLQEENKYRLKAIRRKYQQEKYQSVGKLTVKLQ